MKTFNALQIGGADYSSYFTEDVNWHYAAHIQSVSSDYDFIYIGIQVTAEMSAALKDKLAPYSAYIDYRFSNEVTAQLGIRPIIYHDEADLVKTLKTIAFSGQYGDKVPPVHCIVRPDFTGDVTYEGNTALVVTGTFGTEYKPLLFWRRNLFYEKGKAAELWPEFEVTDGASITYHLRIYRTVTGELLKEVTLDASDLAAPYVLPVADENMEIGVTLNARGSGTIKVRAIHRRWSRLAYGKFLLGGQEYADKQREEFIYYFEPGDLKPPLNVYFSGYRSAEGFEGYFMIKKLGAPFLLIGDPRIEGGAFYIGSEEYERQIVSVIDQHLETLGFDRSQLILSGLSMGSFGALYYGAKLLPAAIIAGKPLTSIGTIADNMRLLRPNDFGTALDILLAETGETSPAAIKALDEKFWQVFRNADFQGVTFALSYMQNDDYDPGAFDDLLRVLSKQNVRVISRSVPGRHNDDTETVANWFVNFYQIALSQFGRTFDD